MKNKYLPIESTGLRLFIATDKEQIIEGQKLRYEVFYKEMGAEPSPQMKKEERDFDRFDDHCEHLLVQDVNTKKIVGTYRMLRREHAASAGSFYSESEYNIDRLKEYDGEILELGRSCVHKDYRSKLVLQLLWSGIIAYVLDNDVKVLFGCASFHGAGIELHKESLSYLYHYHLAPENLRVRTQERYYNDMNIIAKEDLPSPKKIITNLPPLVKGYLGVGAYIADGSFVDVPFNSTDVGIIVETKNIPQKLFEKLYKLTGKK